MGYIPEKFASHTYNLSEKKWNLRKNNLPIYLFNVDKDYKLKTNPILISWSALKILNLLDTPCLEHEGKRLTLSHIKNDHKFNITLNIIDLLKEGYSIKEKLKEPKKNKEEIWRSIQNIINTQNKEFELIRGLIKHKSIQ